MLFFEKYQCKNEYYLSFTGLQDTQLIEAVSSLQRAYEKALQSCGLQDNEVILQQFFCSDVYTHKPMLEQLWPAAKNCLRMYIGQEPLNSAYISVLTYAIKNVQKILLGPDCLEVHHGGYSSLWSQHYPVDTTVNAEVQSDSVIAGLQTLLQQHGLTLEQNVYRTWYYVRDIDNNYTGMIRSRVRAYESAGLTPKTHFIASTGIEAQAPDPHVLVGLRSHAISGLKPEQVAYLKALDYLSPTHAYGVNFERATRITYGDRQHCHHLDESAERLLWQDSDEADADYCADAYDGQHHHIEREALPCDIVPYEHLKRHFQQVHNEEEPRVDADVFAFFLAH